MEKELKDLEEGFEKAQKRYYMKTIRLGVFSLIFQAVALTALSISAYFYLIKEETTIAVLHIILSCMCVPLFFINVRNMKKASDNMKSVEGLVSDLKFINDMKKKCDRKLEQELEK